MYQPWALELHCLKGSLKGKTFPLSEIKTVLGRSANAGISFPSDKLGSREHARITNQHGTLYIEDLDSMNGTWVNDRQITSVVSLKPRDRIRIGEQIFQIKLPPSGLQIRKESRLPKKKPAAKLHLLHSLKEESKIVKEDASLRNPLLNRGLTFFSLFLLVAISAWMTQDSVSQVSDNLPVPAEEQRRQLFPIVQQSHALSFEIEKLLSNYNDYARKGLWDNAFFTVLWGVAWNPEILALQKAVTESGRRLHQDAYVFQRRDTARHALKVAKLSYRRKDPIRVPLILTQAIMDFQLASGFTGSKKLRRETEQLNSFCRIEMKHQLSHHLNSIKSMLSQGREEQAHHKIAELLHHYPHSRDLHQLWSAVNKTRDSSARALATQPQ